jgi:predicted nucleic acid-binding Zn ribbon protein
MSNFDDPKTRERRKKGEDTLGSASDLVKGLMQNVQNPLAVGYLRLKLEVQWEETVGSRLAKMTAPAAFQDGILEIWVAHSAWMQELWFVKDEIRSKVNKTLALPAESPGFCREVRFTLSRRQSSIR